MKILGYNLKFVSSENLAEGAQIYFKIWKIPVTSTLVSGLIVSLMLIILFFFLTRKMRIVPTKRQFVAEFLFLASEYLASLALGKKARQFVPFTGALFFYIFLSNILGFFPIPIITFSKSLIEFKPFLRSPTSDLNSTVGLALCSISYITYYAIKSQGFKNYIKGFFQPSFILSPLNIIGEIAKPFSLSMRLFGNIFSGMLIMALIYKYLPAILPAFFHLYFDIFAGLIQSLIFTSLTTVYMSFAVGNDE